jgi:hypothetical protein
MAVAHTEAARLKLTLGYHRLVLVQNPPLV